MSLLLAFDYAGIFGAIGSELLAGVFAIFIVFAALASVFLVFSSAVMILKMMGRM